jgi:hypothetical protein
MSFNPLGRNPTGIGFSMRAFSFARDNFPHPALANFNDLWFYATHCLLAPISHNGGLCAVTPRPSLHVHCRGERQGIMPTPVCWNDATLSSGGAD